MLRPLQLVVCCVALFGCAAPAFQPTPTSDVFTKQSFPSYLLGTPEKILEGVTSRAAFDLDCPAEQLAYKSLGEQVGVTGCGRRATYKWVDKVGWVMNAASEETPPTPESASPESAPASTEPAPG